MRFGAAVLTRAATLARIALPAAFLLSGCDGRNATRLESIAAQLAAERDQKAALVQQMTSLRRDVDTLSHALATAQGARTDPAAFRQAVGDSVPRAAAVWNGDAQVTLSGPGGSAAALDVLERISARLPAGGISRLSVTARGWQASIFRIEPAPESAAVAIPATAVPELPAPSRLEGAKCGAIRRRIRALRGENEMLDAMMPAAVRLQQRRQTLETEIHSLERADRMVNGSVLFDLFLSGKTPALATGEVAFTADRITLKGTLSPQAPVDLILAALGKHFAVTRKDLAPPALELDLARLSTN